MLENPLAQKIAAFLTEIGIEVVPARLAESTFLPGIDVDGGRLIVDEAALTYPGDLLHEAGHLAVLAPSERARASGEIIAPDAEIEAIETAAIAWSYAAAKHLKIDPREVFHDGGYRDNAAMLLQTYEMGVYLGAGHLARFGLTRVADATDGGGYPAMSGWLRTKE